MSSMTHAELVERAGNWLRSRCLVVFCELKTNLSEIPDAIGWDSSGWSVAVECKTSRSDFSRDQWKTAHRVGQERWYLTPPGLVWPQDVGEHGLIEVRGDRIYRCKTPVNSKLYGQGFTWNHDTSHLELRLLLCAMRRIQLGEPASDGILQRLLLTAQEEVA